jgi:hypothetical protein
MNTKLSPLFSLFLLLTAILAHAVGALPTDAFDAELRKRVLPPVSARGAIYVTAPNQGRLLADATYAVTWYPTQEFVDFVRQSGYS